MEFSRQEYYCSSANSLKDIVYIGVQLIYNVILVSGGQQTDSVKHIHICILCQTLYPYWLLLEY